MCQQQEEKEEPSHNGSSSLGKLQEKEISNMYRVASVRVNTSRSLNLWFAVFEQACIELKMLANGRMPPTMHQVDAHRLISWFDAENDSRERSLSWLCQIIGISHHQVRRNVKEYMDAAKSYISSMG